MSIILSNCQHCDEQQFQTLSCVHYTIFLVAKLDLFIRALLLDRILALEKTTCTPRVHLANIDYHKSDMFTKFKLSSLNCERNLMFTFFKVYTLHKFASTKYIFLKCYFHTCTLI